MGALVGGGYVFMQAGRDTGEPQRPDTLKVSPADHIRCVSATSPR